MELAFNIQGEPFVPPSQVTAWRVRRMRPRGERGALELVYNRDTGRPLAVPLDAAIEDLRRLVGPGRYRLDPVSEDGLQLDDVPAAYIEVIRLRQAAHASTEEDAASEYPASWTDGANTTAPRSGADNNSTEREAMRLTIRLAESVITQFPAMLTSAATLIRAADAAGMPARLPLEITARAATLEREADDTPPAPAPAPVNPMVQLLEAAIKEAAPWLVSALMSRLPGFHPAPSPPAAEPTGASVPAPQAAPSSPHVSATPSPSTEAPAPSHTASPADAEAITAVRQVRMLQILGELTPAERARAQQLAGALTEVERAAWLAELEPLTIAEAVARVRAVLRPTPATSPSTRARETAGIDRPEPQVAEPQPPAPTPSAMPAVSVPPEAAALVDVIRRGFVPAPDERARAAHATSSGVRSAVLVPAEAAALVDVIRRGFVLAADQPARAAAYDACQRIALALGVALNSPAATLVPAPVAASPVAAAVAASPVTTSPVAASPVAASPVATSPVAASPVAASPVAASPVAASPVAASPVAASPVAASPVAASPIAASPVAASPVATSPVATSPVATLVDTLRKLPPEQLLDLAIQRLRAALPTGVSVAAPEPRSSYR